MITDTTYSAKSYAQATTYKNTAQGCLLRKFFFYFVCFVQAMYITCDMERCKPRTTFICVLIHTPFLGSMLLHIYYKNTQA